MQFCRPQLFPILFIIAATFLLGGLGMWQVERLKWKNGILEQMKVAQAEPSLTQLPKEYDGLSYRHVMLKGRFLHDKQFYGVAQPRLGRPGVNVLTPFKLEKDSRVVLVARGWAPRGQETKPAGVQPVEGIIRPLREKRYFAPENQPDKNLWFFEDVAAMGQHAGVELLPFAIEQTGPIPAASKAETFPILGTGKLIFRNDHLTYAITWFSLAITGIIMFILYHRKPKG